MIVRKDECDDWLIELVADPNVSDAWFDHFGGFELVSHFNLRCFEAKAPTVAGEVTPLSAGQSRLATRRRAHGRRDETRLTREPARSGGGQKPASAHALRLMAIRPGSRS